MHFSPDVEEAIDKFAKEDELDREAALALMVRDWLTSQGYLDVVPEELE